MTDERVVQIIETIRDAIEAITELHPDLAQSSNPQTHYVLGVVACTAIIGTGLAEPAEICSVGEGILQFLREQETKQRDTTKD
jgi:hypothetical protein